MVLAITAPTFLTSVLGATVKHPSTDEAMQLLGAHRSSSINYHGIVNPLHSKDEQFSLKKTQKNQIEEGEEEEREPSSRGKSRMNAAIYPTKDRIPDVGSAQVKAWIDEIDWSKVPNIPVAPGLPEAPHFPKCPPDEDVDRESCWWSCDGCVTPSDIMTCPTQKHWGLTYDDGPSEETRGLMKHLQSKNLHATFFIVGSRVLEYPDILKEQVAQGHHLGMHTWSHAGLTTLTNHEIVAEIRWTEKIIRDVTGLTMKYVRPPYGDTDNRVREILRQMGYTTVIWTLGWDTNDWRMLQHQTEASTIVTTFNNALGNLNLIKSSTGGHGGPITLEHDLTTETINLSKRLIPLAQAHGLQPMSLAQCLNDGTPYQHGSTLGPNGATAKSNNGEPQGSARGIPGMEEQDFGNTSNGSSSTEENSSSNTTKNHNHASKSAMDSSDSDKGTKSMGAFVPVTKAAYLAVGVVASCMFVALV
ncbi:chitin deacetylase [Podila humilis]|nr:chitin deacetylase [Podila humilis]